MKVYFISLSLLLFSCKDKQEENATVRPELDRGVRHASEKWQERMTDKHNERTDHDVNAGDLEIKLDELNKRVKDAISNWDSDPIASINDARSIPFPKYVEASPEVKFLMEHLARSVGEMKGAPIEMRMEFIFDILPLSKTASVIDDSIRNQDQEEIRETSDWLKDQPSSRVKTEIYKLILKRMIGLGISRDDIKAWIDSLEYEDEKNEIQQVLELEK